MSQIYESLSSFPPIFYALSAAGLGLIYGRIRWRRLNQSRLTLQSTLDVAIDAYVTVDKRGRFLFANTAALRILGCDAKDLSGKRFTHYLRATDDGTKTMALQRVLNRAVCPSTWHPLTIYTNEGYPICLQIKVRHHTGFRSERFTLCMRDETIGHELEEALRLHRQQLAETRKALQAGTAMIETVVEKRTQGLKAEIEAAEKRLELFQKQNAELERLASRDPMTGCLNRRTFLSALERSWASAARHRRPLSCIMVDVDHFKSVNDNHGHLVGDEVLRGVAALMRQIFRTEDVICRYGGEEFCVLMPEVELDGAVKMAERFRKELAVTKFPCGHITASMGASSNACGAGEPLEMIDQADRSLYTAKRSGRDRVMRFDTLPPELATEEAKKTKERESEEPIPFSTVMGLISALAYRDARTADHCRRVADMCVRVMAQTFTAGQCYVVEIAALLHDIGKIGVSDAILFKASPLNQDEWQVMRQHNQIGMQIVRNTIFHKDLISILEAYHHQYDRNQAAVAPYIRESSGLLQIADAFDSMTVGSVHRSPISREAAFSELRRCVGSQFDGELVERFIQAIESDFDSSFVTSSESLSASAMLRLGQLIELVAATSNHASPAELVPLVQRLRVDALMMGASEIGSVAEALETLVQGDCGLDNVEASVQQLLDLCLEETRRCIQRSAVATAE